MENISKKTINEMAENNQNNNINNKKAKRPYSKFWGATNKANRNFRYQLYKSNAVKRECLRRAAMEVTMDLQKYYFDYMREVNRLTDSQRYCKAAESAGCDANILATHIVFLGSAQVNKVLKVGLEQSGVLQHVNLYKEAFLPADPQEFAK